jgi:hypothetical protein
MFDFSRSAAAVSGFRAAPVPGSGEKNGGSSLARAAANNDDLFQLLAPPYFYCAGF